jgi:group II intron reverse transcriptase/maturase
MSHAQKWQPISPGLCRVQERAQAHREERFTSLAHHLTPELLEAAYRRLKADAAPGIDEETKGSYGQGLERRLAELHERLREMRYRASPIRREWLDKPDGGKRPIGVLVIEDKIAQGAVVEILHSIYEADFYGFSYGFRPGRNAHQALQALQTALQKGRVNWVLDLDLSQCFDSIEHEALIEVIQRRVNDSTLLRLIRKWLTVGTVESDGRRERQTRGTPQGAVISPVLANIVLHEAMDTVVDRFRREGSRGEVYCVRYADDAVLAFEREADAIDLRAELEASLARYGLKLNEAKTRLITFGRQPPTNGDKHGTFDFLGFTHIAGRDRRGRYLVQRKTARKRFRRRLRELAEWMRKHRHRPVRWQWEKLSRALQGHYQYYGVRGNFAALNRYQRQVWRLWLASLRRRSQRANLDRLLRLLRGRYALPPPRITHPEGWLLVVPGHLLRRAGCGNAARPVL